MKKLLYLGTPYNDENKAVEEERLAIFRKIAAEIEISGDYHVISPMYTLYLIEHGHKLPTTWDFWKSYGELLISKCDVIYIIKSQGWDKSKGVIGEIELAKKYNKPLKFLGV